MTKRPNDLFSNDGWENLAKAMSTGSALPDFTGAACAGIDDPDIFYPEDLVKARQAKELCAGCPIRELCFEYAIDNEEYGIWAGTTPRQRAKLRKERAALAAAGKTKKKSDLAEIVRYRDLLESKRSAKEVAAIIGVTDRTIYRWRKELRACKSSDPAKPTIDPTTSQEAS